MRDFSLVEGSNGRGLEHSADESGNRWNALWGLVDLCQMGVGGRYIGLHSLVSMFFGEAFSIENLSNGRKPTRECSAHQPCVRPIIFLHMYGCL